MHTLIFLNGDTPERKVVKYYMKECNFIIAADGGADYLKKVKIIPDIIIGDLDSVKASTLSYFRNKSVLKKIKEQETTDFEKCLMYCEREHKDNIIVFGSSGSRPDHTLNNLSVLKKYHKKFDIRLISGEFEILFIKKEIVFPYKKKETVSLQAMPKAKNINSTGLKYSLKNTDLEFGVKDGALNESVSSMVTINLKSGNLLLFKKHFVK